MTRRSKIQFSAASLVLLMSFITLCCITLDSPVTGMVASMFQPTPTPRTKPKIPLVSEFVYFDGRRTHIFKDGVRVQVLSPSTESSQYGDMPTPDIEIYSEEEYPGEFSETETTPVSEDKQPSWDQYDMLRIAWSGFGVLCFLTYFPFRLRHRAVT